MRNLTHHEQLAHGALPGTFLALLGLVQLGLVQLGTELLEHSQSNSYAHMCTSYCGTKSMPLQCLAEYCLK
eukprot:1160802-Pelagomonas_calceolata.AAC.10